MPDIDERFAYLTAGDGHRYQVLSVDGEGAPIGWDEAATAAAFKAGEAAKLQPAAT